MKTKTIKQNNPLLSEINTLQKQHKLVMHSIRIVREPGAWLDAHTSPTRRQRRRGQRISETMSFRPLTFLFLIIQTRIYVDEFLAREESSGLNALSPVSVQGYFSRQAEMNEDFNCCLSVRF